MTFSEAQGANSCEVLWFLPTHGDGHYLGTGHGARTVSHRYLAQNRTGRRDELGFAGVLLPTGRSCEDSWVVASSLLALTERLKFLVAVRPGLLSPTLAARMTATLDRMSKGRLLINVVTGGDPVENRGDGIFLDHAQRYEITDEFLNIYIRLLKGETVSAQGKHLQVEDGSLIYPPYQTPLPPLYFGGVFRYCAGYRRPHHRQIFDVGRAAATGRRENRGDAAFGS